MATLQEARGYNFDVDDSYFERVVWPQLSHRFPQFEKTVCKGTRSGLYDQNDFDGNVIIGPGADGLGNFHMLAGFSGHGLMSGPEPHLGGRTIDEKMGKVIGGSSSINAMIYNRGNPMDYDGWADDGLLDWDYAHCLPYFRKMERKLACDHLRTGAFRWRASSSTASLPPSLAFNSGWICRGRRVAVQCG